jgi:hypothetical protein
MGTWIAHVGYGLGIGSMHACGLIRDNWVPVFDFGGLFHPFVHHPLQFSVEIDFDRWGHVSLRQCTFFENFLIFFYRLD